MTLPSCTPGPLYKPPTPPTVGVSGPHTWPCLKDEKSSGPGPVRRNLQSSKGPECSFPPHVLLSLPTNGSRDQDSTDSSGSPKRRDGPVPVDGSSMDVKTKTRIGEKIGGRPCVDKSKTKEN